MILNGEVFLNRPRHARKIRCRDCALLDLKVVQGGRVVYWCQRKRRALTDGYVWRTVCSHAVPIQREA